MLGYADRPTPPPPETATHVVSCLPVFLWWVTFPPSSVFNVHPIFRSFRKQKEDWFLPDTSNINSH